jgi:hypothetical protein
MSVTGCVKVMILSDNIDHLQVVTTNNYNIIANFHTPNYSTLSLHSLHSLVVAW